MEMHVDSRNIGAFTYVAHKHRSNPVSLLGREGALLQAGNDHGKHVFWTQLGLVGRTGCVFGEADGRGGGGRGRGGERETGSAWGLPILHDHRSGPTTWKMTRMQYFLYQFSSHDAWLPPTSTMAPASCALCNVNRALILRPKDHSKLCKTCFISVFETEIHHTITTNALFQRGEKVAIGASGGKDSTVLASVLKTLNERYDYGLDLILLSIDEGIKGYRDDSLETVKRNAEQYGMELTILGYDELYGWTMDQVVEQVGKKGNCTYCGVFRRQALDRGAARLGVRHVVTGHNADDVAETVLMNCKRMHHRSTPDSTANESSTEGRLTPSITHNFNNHVHALCICESCVKHKHQAQQAPQVRLRKGDCAVRSPQEP